MSGLIGSKVLREENLNTVAGMPSVTRGLQFYAPFQGDKRAYIKDGKQIYTDPDSETVDSDGSYVEPYAPDYFHVDATTNQMRLERNGAIIEPAETNSFLHSQDLSNAVWVFPNDATVGSNVTRSPNNLVEGDAIVEDGTVGGTFDFNQSFTFSGVKLSHLVSYWVKRGTRDFLRVNVPLAAPVDVDFNLLTETVCATSGALDAGVIHKGRNDSWIKIWVAFDAEVGDAGAKAISFIASDSCGGITYNGVNTDEAVFFWQGDFKPATNALTTSIPTVGSAVTRAGDLISFANDELVAASAFTIFVVVDVPYSVNAGSDRYLFENFFDGDDFINMLIFRTNGAYSASMTVGGVSQFAKVGTTVIANGINTIALVVDTNDMRGYMNAIEDFSDGSVDLPDTFATSNFVGHNPNATDRQVASPLSHLCIYNVALTGDEMTLLDNQYRP